MSSKVESYNNRKNPMAEWIRQFKALTENEEGEHLLRDLINNFITVVDPAMQGEITPEQMSLLNEDAQIFLEQNAEILNDKGNYDFYKYLSLIKDTSSSLTQESIDFINTSYLFKEIPANIDEA
jgi:hypothetical protein